MPRLTLDLDDRRMIALAELVKRLARSKLGPGGLGLTNPHIPDEEHEAEQAIYALARALRDAGFDPR